MIIKLNKKCLTLKLGINGQKTINSGPYKVVNKIESNSLM